MNSESRANNRLKFALITLVLALVLTLSGIVAIWAAQQQNVSSQFSVVYEVGENVAVAVKTESYIPGLDANKDGKQDDAVIATKDSDGNTVATPQGFVIFNAPDAYTPKEVKIEDVSLSPETPKVIFYYTIENILAQGYAKYDFTQTLTKNTNVKVTTYYYTGDVTPSNSATKLTETGWETTNVLNLEHGKATAIKVEIEAEDKNQEAQCAGAFSLTFTYTANELRDAGTVNKSAFLSQTANTSSVVFDKYTSGETYTGVTLGSGTDISSEQNGSVKIYNVGDTSYVLSNEAIMFPEDSSYMFATEVPSNLMQTSTITRRAKTNIKLNNVNTTMVRNMSNMFAGSTATELDLSGFNTIKVRTMSNMFNNCSNLTKIYISNSWQTETVTSSTNMFKGCISLKNYNDSSTDKSKANGDNGGYLTGQVVATAGTLSKNLWFEVVSNTWFTEAYFDAYTSMSAEEYVVDGTNVISGKTGKDISEEQNGSIKLYVVTDRWGVHGYILAANKIAFPEDSSEMFKDNVNLKTIDFIAVDTSNVTNMSYMFAGCSSLQNLNLSWFNTVKVTNMSYMFSGCSNLKNVYLSNFNTTNLSNVAYMFERCVSLQSVNMFKLHYEINAQRGFCQGMFYECSNLITVDLSNFYIKIPRDVRSMFYNCSKLTTIYADQKIFEDIKRGYADNMFYGCVNLPNFDANKVDNTNAHTDADGYLTYKAKAN